MNLSRYYSKFLSSLIALLIVAATSQNLYAQSFDEGVSLYKQGKYTQAVNIFNQINSQQAKLFSGKAYFGLGQYLTAKSYLSQIT